jgi:hypothetical protein
LCTKKRPRHMALEILVLAWDRHNNLSGLNWLMRSQPSSPDNWYLTSILFFFFKSGNLYTCRYHSILITVKPIVRGHLWDKEKVAL